MKQFLQLECLMHPMKILAIEVLVSGPMAMLQELCNHMQCKEVPIASARQLLILVDGTSP